MLFIDLFIDLLRPKAAHNIYKDRKKHRKLESKIHQKFETVEQIKYIRISSQEFSRMTYVSGVNNFALYSIFSGRGSLPYVS